MRENKRWGRIAVGLVIAGLLLGAGALASVGFDFSRLSTASYTTNTYIVDKPFQSITVIGDTEKIAFVPSEDGVCRVICREEEKAPHTVRIDGDMLTIENTDSRAWHFINFSFFTDPPAVTVCLPGQAYGALSVKASTGNLDIPADFSFDSIQASLTTGDIACRASAKGALALQTSTGRIILSGVQAESVQLKSSTGSIQVDETACSGSMEIHVSTGRTALSSVTCGSLTSTGSTGSLALTGVIANGAMHLQRSTGSIRLDGCDAGEISADTSTGSISGTLLTEKTFSAHSSTGRVNVPGTAGGGRCSLTSGTGSISIEIKNGN